ncbi:hypothetical protein ACRDNQ_03475 [Palleronia sp. KMU-117]|uniref:hypothetical protein n=1 Tax=Palleronia sp. KMU-117 TaxID=3434108 RepID=UPI003D755C73
MVLGIVMVGWIVGAAGATIAAVVGDPGFFGGLAVFMISSVVGSLAAAMSLALRPDGQSRGAQPGDIPDHEAALRPRAKLTPVAAPQRAAALAEAAAQRPS